MKRLFFTITLAACMFSLSSFALEENPEALNAFYKTFRKAQNVSWTQVNDLLRIGFTMNGLQQFAYYSDAELVVVATEITTEGLPEVLKAHLSDYRDYTVTQAYELAGNRGKEYCVMMKSPSQQIILKGKTRWKLFVDNTF